MQHVEPDYTVIKSEDRNGVREITELELRGVSLPSAYPLLRTQVVRPRRDQKRKLWLKQG